MSLRVPQAVATGPVLPGACPFRWIPAPVLKGAWGVAILIGGLLPAPLPEAPVRDSCAMDEVPVLERRVHVMGTFLSVRAWGDRHSAAGAVEQAVREVERMDALLSTWRPGTGLDRLNRAPAGEPVQLPQALFDLLSEVQGWSRATGGAFDPGVGPLVDAWGVRSGGRTPEPAEVRAALEAVRAGVTLDPVGRTGARNHPGSWLDSGAFGKGAGLRDAAVPLRQSILCGAVLDFGGQLLVLGGPRPVGVAHPLRREEPVASLAVADASVATSGPSERPGHLLDPRTGHPAPWEGSVTVVAEDPLVADILSTALHVLGPAEGMRWAEGRMDVGVLFLEETPHGLRARWNPSMRRWLDQPPVSIGPAASPARGRRSAGPPSKDSDPDTPHERNEP